MAYYQILYWQNIPSQIKAWDEFEEVKIELPQKFVIKMDALAKAQGLVDENSYLEQWKWSDEFEKEETPAEVADLIKSELEKEIK